jgi:hypothetical protein
MNIRETNVLYLKITLVPILKEHWNVSFSELSSILKEYSILDYIDACYEVYNSTGIQGILDDIDNFIKEQRSAINEYNKVQHKRTHKRDSKNIRHRAHRGHIYNFGISKRKKTQTR